jgi:hypothetical protein
MITLPVKNYSVSLANNTITLLLHTNDTGSYIGQVPRIDLNNVSLVTFIEVTGSSQAGLWQQVFDGVKIVSFEEQVTGSIVRPILKLQAPTIHQRQMQADGVTIKLRDIKSVIVRRRPRQSITDYIEFK